MEWHGVGIILSETQKRQMEMIVNYRWTKNKLNTTSILGGEVEDES